MSTAAGQLEGSDTSVLSATAPFSGNRVAPKAGFFTQERAGPHSGTDDIAAYCMLGARCETRDRTRGDGSWSLRNESIPGFA